MKLSTDRVEDILFVQMEGDNLDVSNVEEFKRQATEVLQGESKVVLDLSSLEFVDSSGLGAFLSCMRRVVGNGGQMKICGISGAVRALFELVRLHRVVDILNTREEAVESMK